MPHIVDLHIHSHYSRATSPSMNLDTLYRWGKIKGIHVIGTGDFTHPLWFSSLSEKLGPAEHGLFSLKNQYAREQDKQLSSQLKSNPLRFILTSEISTIYKRHGKVRKVHSIIVSPSLSSVEKLNKKLGTIGNLRSDGRPILGLDCVDLLQIVLDIDPTMMFIPAHAWTPWFSVFGSKSGFDSIEEAFSDLSPHIHAIETGLSSDPQMNRRISALDNITLISNSDAHSPAKLGREANLIDSKLTYTDLRSSIETNDERMVGTIEFFPEEGKYHVDGHRACDVMCTPKESLKMNNICPNCKRELTLGVEHRVEELADREKGYVPKNAKKVEYIVPLVELISQVKNVKSSTSKRVMQEYHALINQFGDEFSLLRTISTKEIATAGFTDIALAIQAVREKRVKIQPGYDGVFGAIKADLQKRPQNEHLEQMSLL